MIAQGQKNSNVQMVLAMGMMLLLAGVVLTDARGQITEPTVDPSLLSTESSSKVTEETATSVSETPAPQEKIVSRSSEPEGNKKSLLARIISQQQRQIHTIEVRFNDSMGECEELIKENGYYEKLYSLNRI